MTSLKISGNIAQENHLCFVKLCKDVIDGCRRGVDVNRADDIEMVGGVTDLQYALQVLLTAMNDRCFFIGGDAEIQLVGQQAPDDGDDQLENEDKNKDGDGGHLPDRQCTQHDKQRVAECQTQQMAGAQIDHLCLSHAHAAVGAVEPDEHQRINHQQKDGRPGINFYVGLHRFPESSKNTQLQEDTHRFA